MNLLLIDDDYQLAKLLTRYLESHGWSLQHAATPSQAYSALARQQPDAIILDIMLPEEDGFQVCRKIREQWTIPIIMLTARGDVTDRVVGLELGADDYLPKPFEPRELAARIKSLVRRSQLSESQQPGIASEHQPAELIFKGMRINPVSHEVFLDNYLVSLTTSEFRLLHLFAQQPGKVFTRDEIMNLLKGTEVELFSRAIDITVSRLRQKLKLKSKREYIKTIWGSGYRFVGEAV